MSGNPVYICSAARTTYRPTYNKPPDHEDHAKQTHIHPHRDNSYRDRQREFEGRINSALDEAVAAEREARTTEGRSLILLETDTTDGFDIFKDVIENIPVEDIASIKVYKSGTTYTDAIRRIVATVPDSDCATRTYPTPARSQSEPRPGIRQA